MTSRIRIAALGMLGAAAVIAPACSTERKPEVTPPDDTFHVSPPTDSSEEFSTDIDECFVGTREPTRELVEGAAGLTSQGHLSYGFGKLTSIDPIPTEVKITINGIEISDIPSQHEEIFVTGDKSTRGFDTWAEFDLPPDTKTIRIENIPSSAQPGPAGTEPCVLEFNLKPLGETPGGLTV